MLGLLGESRRQCLGEMSRTLIERFLDKIGEPFDSHNDCWLWCGGKTGSGYGQIRNGRRKMCAHCLSHELFIGPIPEGHAVDHLCRVRHCVNPDHLRALSHHENYGQASLSKTHCKNGHEYSEVNTYRSRRQRHCRICMRDANRRFQMKRKSDF